MSELLLCGRVTEHDGDIVSVALWSVAEFVPIGSPEHRAMVAQRLRILPVETPESKLVGRKRPSFWQRFWGHQQT